jgi:type I restriction enzyme S subunit
VKAKAEGGDLDDIAQELGMSKEILALFPNEFEESELGLIPKGWEVQSLDKIANYKNGLALQKFRPDDENNFLPVVKISQLNKGFADGEEKASPNINPECIIDNGDVVFSWSGSLIVDIWCGGKAALNQHLFKVTSNDYPKWFYLFYTKHHLDNFQKIASGKAVTMGHIKREHLTQALCVVPDEVFLEKISKFIGDKIQKTIDFRLENQTLTQLRDTLLPKLLSGEITIASADKIN